MVNGVRRGNEACVGARPASPGGPQGHNNARRLLSAVVA
jgi:hypothetical protein